MYDLNMFFKSSNNIYIEVAQWRSLAQLFQSFSELGFTRNTFEKPAPTCATAPLPTFFNIY